MNSHKLHRLCVSNMRDACVILPDKSLAPLVQVQKLTITKLVADLNVPKVGEFWSCQDLIGHVSAQFHNGTAQTCKTANAFC